MVRTSRDIKKRRQRILQTLEKTGGLEWRKLLKRIGVSEATLFRDLEELKKEGLVYKGADDKWRLNRAGFTSYKLKNILINRVESWRPILTKSFGMFFTNRPVEEGNSPLLYVLEVFRGYFGVLDFLEEIACRFYLSVAYDLVFREKKFRVEELVRPVAEAIAGGVVKSEEKLDVGNVLELYEKLSEIYPGLRKEWVISWFFVKGMGIKETEELAALVELDFFGYFTIMLLEQYPKAREIFKSVKLEEPADFDPKLLREFFKQLLEYKLLITIPIDPEFTLTHLRYLALSEFEEWVEALEDGRLDHRIWLWESGDYGLSLLERFVAKWKRKGGPSIEDLDRRLDHQEGWTLQDIYFLHPRGKQLSFYEELLEKMRKRAEIRELEKRMRGRLVGFYF